MLYDVCIFVTVISMQFCFTYPKFRLLHLCKSTATASLQIFCCFIIVVQLRALTTWQKCAYAYGYFLCIFNTYDSFYLLFYDDEDIIEQRKIQLATVCVRVSHHQIWRSGILEMWCDVHLTRGTNATWTWIFFADERT